MQIKVAMAAVIPGPFGLVLFYTPSPPSQSFGSYVTQVTDLSFADVNEVTYKIPQQKLPTMFNSFSVKVALLARGVQGDPSNDSNIISKSSLQCVYHIKYLLIRLPLQLGLTELCIHWAQLYIM